MAEIISTGFDVAQSAVDAGTTNRAWKVYQQPTGKPVLGKDVAFVEEAIPELKDGQFLVRAKFLSVDPYHRGTLNEVSYGKKQAYPRTMHGQVVGKVVKTKTDDVAVGDYVSCYGGYQDYSVAQLSMGAKKLDKFAFGDLPLSYALGSLGMPGATAFYGLLDICNPQPGETVAVSAATGAVGSLVGQIAKIKGCKVIGFAGSEEKCEYARSTLGFDACLLYKDQTLESLSTQLKEVAPDGIDCYFDNTGGVCTNAVQLHMNLFGRMSICGQIAYYNDPKPINATFPVMLSALSKQLTIRGFIISSLRKDWSEARANVGSWIQSGEIKVREDVTEGTDNAFNAFLSLFRGISTEGEKKINFGKKIVKFY